MTEGGARIDLMGTLLNGETGGGMGRSPKGALLPLPAWVWELGEGDARNEAEANIAIEGGRESHVQLLFVRFSGAQGAGWRQGIPPSRIR